MAYYLSKKDEKRLEPFLQTLLKSNRTITFNSPSPKRLHSLLRTAFNVLHPQLKDKFSLRSADHSVICEYKDIQISLDIQNIIDEPIRSISRIGDDIINKNIPVKYIDCILSESEVSSLSLLKEYKISYNSPTLEITYA